MSTEIEYVGRRHRVFRVYGILINFEEMRRQEGLSSRTLYAALADDMVKPAVGNMTKVRLQRRYDEMPKGSAGETAVLKALALHYRTDNVDIAKAPILDQGKAAEQAILPFHRQQGELHRGSQTADVVSIKKAKKRKR